MRTISYVLCPAVLLMIVTGCATNASRTEMDYATSYKLAIANQTLHPEAGGNMTPVAGIQAPAAAKIYEKYVKGFETTKPESLYVIPLGAEGGTFK